MGEWRQLQNLPSSFTQEGLDVWGCNIQRPVRMVELWCTELPKKFRVYFVTIIKKLCVFYGPKFFSLPC